MRRADHIVSAAGRRKGLVAAATGRRPRLHGAAGAGRGRGHPLAVGGQIVPLCGGVVPHETVRRSAARRIARLRATRAGCARRCAAAQVRMAPGRSCARSRRRAACARAASARSSEGRACCLRAAASLGGAPGSCAVAESRGYYHV